MIVLPLLFHSVSQQNAHQVQTPNRKAILIAVKGDPFVGLPEVFSPGSPRCSEAIFSQSFFIPLSVRKFSVKVQKAYSLHPCVILFTYLKSYHIQTDFVKECRILSSDIYQISLFLQRMLNLIQRFFRVRLHFMIMIVGRDIHQRT